jgi:hypothetical protein
MKHADEDVLDRLLLGAGVEPVANEGFSERLMLALPARPRKTPTALGMAIAVGSLLASWQLSGSEFLRVSANELQHGIPGMAAFAVLATVLMLALTLAGMALADE